MKVLIVEADAPASRSIGHLLEHYGCDVAHAQTVAEGLKHLEAAPELVLLELTLPDGEGVQLLEQVRLRGMRSRVVVLTARQDRPTLRRVEALRPEALLHKPVNFFQILEVMQAA